MVHLVKAVERFIRLRRHESMSLQDVSARMCPVALSFRAHKPNPPLWYLDKYPEKTTETRIKAYKSDPLPLPPPLPKALLFSLQYNMSWLTCVYRSGHHRAAHFRIRVDES